MRRPRIFVCNKLQKRIRFNLYCLVVLGLGLIYPMIHDIVPIKYRALSNFVEEERVCRQHKHSQNLSGPMPVPNRVIRQVTADRKNKREEYRARFTWPEG